MNTYIIFTNPLKRPRFLRSPNPDHSDENASSESEMSIILNSLEEPSLGGKKTHLDILYIREAEEAGLLLAAMSHVF
jgi:hypothetical protein